ncbi:hypothetical protein H5410_025774 [Solanum commersonii]|uniref:Uncharacterized protein n=1 Tax=Solanum commersonii TaxID=4109 RepID=A0A9J5YV57_SOLCO|nr:hypothetical protein H5410_025774 [Solanum commersonii]
MLIVMLNFEVGLTMGYKMTKLKLERIQLIRRRRWRCEPAGSRIGGTDANDDDAQQLSNMVKVALVV